MAMLKVERTGVIIWHHSALHAMDIVNQVWASSDFGIPVITGAQEEGHGAARYRSLHYGTAMDIRCRAFDVRLPNKEYQSLAKVAATLQYVLGTAFDVVLEKRASGSYSHFHIEFDFQRGELG